MTPPPFQGGQGRVPADLTADGIALALYALLAVAVLVTVWGAA